MKNICSDYGACPGSDCTAAFQAATQYQGHVFVPASSQQYIWSGQQDACVVVTGSTRFVGENWPNTQIIYKAPPGVDAITFRPTPGQWCDGAGLTGLSIAPAPGYTASPSGTGRYAVRIDLGAPGAQLRNPAFSHLFLVAAAGADAAFKLDNPVNENGFYCVKVGPSCAFVGGIKLFGCGDSVSILDSILTGPNAGVYATFEPGAARLKVGRCNITSDGGAAVLYGALQASIENCQCEQENPYNGGYNGMFILSGCVDCEIVANNINNHGNTAGIVLENGTNCTVVARNSLTTAGSAAHILIGPNSPTNALCSSNRYRGAPGGDGIAVNYVDVSSPLWTIAA